MEELIEAVLQKIFVPLEASGRHVHMTEDQARTLFGHGLTPERELSQPGQYLCRERVNVIGSKGKFPPGPPSGQAPAPPHAEIPPWGQ